MTREVAWSTLTLIAVVGVPAIVCVDCVRVVEFDQKAWIAWPDVPVAPAVENPCIDHGAWVSTYNAVLQGEHAGFWWSPTPGLIAENSANQMWGGCHLMQLPQKKP